MEPVTIKELDTTGCNDADQRHATDEEAAQVKGGPHFRTWDTYRGGWYLGVGATFNG